MRHFDIIYIHKWNYGGGCCCCLHWRDVKNSWQTKKKVDRYATYMNLNMGLWTSGGPVSIINNQKKAFLWCLCTLLPLSLCVCVCADGTRVYYNMYVCVCETSFRYADDEWKHLTDSIHFCPWLWNTVTVCACVFKLAPNMPPCCLLSGKPRLRWKVKEKGIWNAERSFLHFSFKCF